MQCSTPSLPHMGYLEGNFFFIPHATPNNSLQKEMRRSLAWAVFINWFQHRDEAKIRVNAT